MSNLTPEPRTDINGKVTTRWVRSAPAKTSRALLAAPVPPAEEVLHPATEESAPLLTKFLNQINNGAEKELPLSELHPLVAHRLEEMMTVARGNGPGEYSVFRGDLGLVLLDAMHEEEANNGPASESRAIHNFAALGGPKGESFPLLLAGLRNRPEFQSVSNFFFELSSEDQKRAAALYKVTCSVDQVHRDVSYYEEDEDGFEYVIPEEEQYVGLKSSELADFVLENPDLADDVIGIVNERWSTDVGMIREILRGEVPVMGTGIL